jgi:hypothetical protein
MLGTHWVENYLKAGSPETSPSQLAVLAYSDNHKIRIRVAENPRTPPELLSHLAKDSESDVRLAVATNRSCPAPVVRMLASDADPTVRHGLAEDPNTRFEVLRILTNDPNPYVSCRARKTMQALGLLDCEPTESHQWHLWTGNSRRRFA